VINRRWATVLPEQGRLEPGAAADIRLTAIVTAGPGGTAETVCAEGRCRLEAIMVLRVAGGNDLFFTVSGAYRPSCFGLTLATLSGLPRCGAAEAGSRPADGTGVLRVTSTHCECPVKETPTLALIGTRRSRVLKGRLCRCRPLVAPGDSAGLGSGGSGLHIDTEAPADAGQPSSPAAAAGKPEFYSPTSSLNSPMADATSPQVRQHSHFSCFADCSTSEVE